MTKARMAVRTSDQSATRRRPRDAQARKETILLPELSFCLQEILLDRAAEAGLLKGERTLLKLKAGAAAALQSKPYQILRVADIVAEAGVSHGLFYHYFEDKEQITIDVLTEMLVCSEQRYRDIHALENDYESLFVPNLFYLEVYKRNAGLMRACLTLAEEVNSFRNVWNESVDRWHRRIAAGIRAHAQTSALLPDAELTAYSVGGMIDQLGRLIFVQNNPFVGRLASDIVHLAEIVTILWYRAVYGRDPDILDVRACRERYGQARPDTPDARAANR